MKKIVSLVGLIVFVAIVLESNLAFADRIDDLKRQFESALNDAQNYPPITWKLIRTAGELGDIGDARALYVLVEGLKNLWNYYSNNKEPYETFERDIDSASKGIVDAVIKLSVGIDKQNPNELDKIIPDLFKLLEDNTSVSCKYRGYWVSDFPVSFAAGDILIEIAKQNPNRTDEIRNTFLKAMNDERTYIQRGAIYALGEIGGPGVVSCLRKALLDKSNWMIRRNAVIALGKITSPDVTEVTDDLINMLKNVDEVLISDYVITSLSQIAKRNPSEENKIAAALAGVLGNESRTWLYGYHTVSENAVEALDKIGSAAVPYLIQALEHKENRDISIDTCMKIVDSLGDIGDPRAVPVLVKIFEDKNVDHYGYLTINLLTALGKIAKQNPSEVDKIVPVLIKALANPTSFMDKPLIGGVAKDTLIGIGEPVIKLVQEFVMSGEGTDQAIKLANEVLDVLGSPISEPTGMLIPQLPYNNNSVGKDYYYGLVGGIPDNFI